MPASLLLHCCLAERGRRRGEGVSYENVRQMSGPVRLGYLPHTGPDPAGPGGYHRRTGPLERLLVTPRISVLGFDTVFSGCKHGQEDKLGVQREATPSGKSESSLSHARACSGRNTHSNVKLIGPRELWGGRGPVFWQDFCTQA